MPGPQPVGASHRLAGNRQQLLLGPVSCAGHAPCRSGASSQPAPADDAGATSTAATQRLAQGSDRHIHNWMLRQDEVAMKLMAGQDRIEALLQASMFGQELAYSPAPEGDIPSQKRPNGIAEPVSARSAPTGRRMQPPEERHTALPQQPSHEMQPSMMQRLSPRQPHARVLDSHHCELQNVANAPKLSLAKSLDIDSYKPAVLQSTLINAPSATLTQTDVLEGGFENEMAETTSKCQRGPTDIPAKDRDSSFGDVIGGVQEPNDEVQEPKDGPNGSKSSRSFRITEITSATVDSSEHGDNAENTNWDASSHWRKMIRKQERKNNYKGKHSSSSGSLTGASGEEESRLTAFIKGPRYENAGMFLVVINAIFIGFQVEHMASRHTHLPSRMVYDITFTFLFTAEFLGKAYGWGRRLLSRDNVDLYWNIFDLVLVLFMWLEVAMELELVLASDVHNVSMMRILRVLRLVRVVKLLRTLTFFRELRLMILAITNGSFCLIWVIAVLGTAFYIFGVGITQGANEVCPGFSYGEGGQEELKKLCNNFGTLPRSILSLYAAMSGGVSWIDLFHALTPLGHLYRGIFLFYTIFSIFAVSNIITGIFVDSAMQSSKNDHDTVVEDEMQKLEQYVSAIHDMFVELDQDGSGTVAVSEFMQVVKDDKMAAYFNALGLEITDVKMLFALMDRDHTGAIDIEEFLAGCMRLKGQAKSIDLAKLALQSEWMLETLENICDGMRNHNGGALARPTWRS